MERRAKTRLMRAAALAGGSVDLVVGVAMFTLFAAGTVAALTVEAAWVTAREMLGGRWRRESPYSHKSYSHNAREI